MPERYLQGTIINDPEWIDELGSFLTTTKDKEIIKKHKELFKKTYFHYLKRGMSPKEAIEKAKKVIFSFLK